MTNGKRYTPSSVYYEEEMNRWIAQYGQFTAFCSTEQAAKAWIEQLKDEEIQELH